MFHLWLCWISEYGTPSTGVHLNGNGWRYMYRITLWKPRSSCGVGAHQSLKHTLADAHATHTERTYAHAGSADNAEMNTRRVDDVILHLIRWFNANRAMYQSWQMEQNAHFPIKSYLIVWATARMRESNTAMYNCTMCTSLPTYLFNLNICLVWWWWNCVNIALMCVRPSLSWRATSNQ